MLSSEIKYAKQPIYSAISPVAVSDRGADGYKLRRLSVGAGL